MFIDGSLQIGDVGGGNGYMNIHTLSQHDLYLNNGDVSCVNGFIKIETISQCNESSCFNYMDGDVENGDMNGEHGSMKIHTLYQ